MDTSVVLTFCLIVVLLILVLHYRGLYKSTFNQLKSAIRERDIDALTNVYSRAGFRDLAEKVYASHKRDPKTFITVAYIDLDNFKGINDKRGHDFGDYVLGVFGKILRSNVRETDIVGRMGGDEFVVLFVNTTDTTEVDVRGILTRVREDFERDIIALYSFTGDKETPNVSMSFGLAQHKVGRESTLDELLQKADKELYKQKARRGRGCR